MKTQTAKFDADARRAMAKRTALILGAVAVAVYALAIIEAVLKR
jgi:hypothetical protein